MAMASAASHDEVRRNNLARILRRLHLHGAASRSELVALTGLNRSTVGALVADLAEAGLVSEQAGATGSVGRPSLVVVPEPRSAVVLAFDFRVDRIVGAVVGLGGQVLSRAEQRHRRSGYGPDAAARQMTSIAQELLAAVPEGAVWVGTGVGVPGIVDTGAGVVKLAPNLGWVDAPLGDLLTRALSAALGDVPHVVIANDADLGAVSEHSRGAASGARNVIYLSGEIGIGGGVVVDDRLLSGAGGYGGEVGHMIVNPSGDVCHCGSRGCWETVVGRDVLMRAAGRAADDTDVSEIAAAARAGDAQALQALEVFGGWLGIGLRNLVNIFNPEVIVLGGHLGAALPEITAAVTTRMDESIKASLEQVRVVVPALQTDSTLMGAAEMAFTPLLANPLDTLEESSTLVAS